MTEIRSQKGPPLAKQGGDDGSPRSRAVPWRLLPYIGLAIASFIGAIELVKWLWMDRADEHGLDTIHLIRGVGLAILIVLSVSWFLLRTAPPLPVGGPAVQPLTGTLERDRQRREFCAFWFVQMRWVAVVVGVGLVLLATVVLEILPREVMVPLLLMSAGLALFNVWIATSVRAGRAPPFVLQLQVYVDLVALNAMLHMSGGIENPLYILALFHVIIGGIILSRRQCFFVAATAAFLGLLVAWTEWGGILAHYTLEIFPHGEVEEIHASTDASYVATYSAVFVCALMLTAYFVTRLTGQLRSDERNLEAMARQAYSEHGLLEQALDTTSTGVRVLDVNKRLRWANDQWKSWFGDPIRPDTGSKQWEAMDRTLADGKPCTLEVEGDRGKDGRRSWYRVVTAAIVDQSGQPSEVVELVLDITRQKEEQERMMRAGQLAAVGELASHVAHEVNNPIAIMSAKARLLLSKFSAQVPEKVVQDLAAIVDLSDRVAHVAQGLLSYSRPSTGPREPVDVREAVDKAVDLVKQRHESRSIRIVSASGDIPLVNANAGELGQVLLNLLLNGIDATPHGGKIAVSVSAGHRPGNPSVPGVVIEVSDTGCGIPEEIQERIFEPFFTTKEEKKGTGLGLSICFGLIKGYGGTIEVTSRVGLGTTFTVWLPATES